MSAPIVELASWHKEVGHWKSYSRDPLSKPFALDQPLTKLQSLASEAIGTLFTPRYLDGWR